MCAVKPKILSTLPGYNWPTFLSDLFAGVTVAMVALPLSLAIAIASGAPPATGLITAIVGGLLISLLGGSRVQIGGPTGAFIVVVYSVIHDHGFDGLVIATLMAGIILLVAGFFRAGSLIEHVPEAVINGFTVGIGIIIGTSQLKDFFGLTTGPLPADFLEKLPVLWDARETASFAAFGIALGALILITVARRLAPRLPGLIVVMALASAVVAFWQLPVDTIESRFGALPQSLPLPHVPEITRARLMELLPSALVIAFLAGIESLLSAVVADRMIGGAHRPNAELAAQGWANVGSALFGGLPATGAIARTATNVKAGGLTPVAGVIHALVIALVVLVAAPLAGRIALPALAALLMLTAWNMTEPHRWKEWMQGRRSDRFLLLLTLVLTVVADLTIAIGVGVALGLAIRLRRREVPAAAWKPPEH